MHYQAKITVTKQEDGLWRLQVPGMKGAWVDAPSLEQGFSEIQEAIAMMLKYYLEREWPLPESITGVEGPPHEATIPIILNEYYPRQPAAKRHAVRE